MRFLLVVRYKDWTHREEFETTEHLLRELGDRIADYEQHDNVRHWKVIPS